MFLYSRHFDLNSAYTKYQYIFKDRGLNCAYICVCLFIQFTLWVEVLGRDESKEGIVRAATGTSLLARSRGKLL